MAGIFFAYVSILLKGFFRSFVNGYEVESIKSRFLRNGFGGGVRIMKSLEVIEDSVGNLFADFSVNLIIGDEDSHNGNGINVNILSSVGVGGNSRYRIEGIFSGESLSVNFVDRENANLILASNVLNSGSREASGNECRIDGFIFEGVGTFGEGEELFIDVVVGESVGFEDLASISLRAGTRCADCDAFTFQLFDGGDATILTDDELAGFGV